MIPRQPPSLVLVRGGKLNFASCENKIGSSGGHNHGTERNASRVSFIGCVKYGTGMWWELMSNAVYCGDNQIPQNITSCHRASSHNPLLPGRSSTWAPLQRWGCGPCRACRSPQRGARPDTILRKGEDEIFGEIALEAYISQQSEALPRW